MKDLSQTAEINKENVDKAGIVSPSLSFLQELQSLINKHSKENDSNTPDFILALYLNNCLTNFNLALQHRSDWYSS